MGVSPKWVKSRRRREKKRGKKERLNNGQINAWTRGGPGGHDRTLAVKSKKKNENQPREIPRSGSKANDGEKR